MQRYTVFETAGGLLRASRGATPGSRRFQLPAKQRRGRRAAAARGGCRTPSAGDADRGGGRGADRGGAALLRRRAGRLRRRAASTSASRSRSSPGSTTRVRQLGWGETHDLRHAGPRASAPGRRRRATSGRRWRGTRCRWSCPATGCSRPAASVGGFSAPGGAATKRRMLALEGVRLEPPRRRRRRRLLIGQPPLPAAAARRYEGGRGRRARRGQDHGDHLAVGLRRTERLSPSCR